MQAQTNSQESTPRASEADVDACKRFYMMLRVVVPSFKIIVQSRKE